MLQRPATQLAGANLAVLVRRLGEFEEALEEFVGESRAESLASLAKNVTKKVAYSRNADGVFQKFQLASLPCRIAIPCGLRATLV